MTRIKLPKESWYPAIICLLAVVAVLPIAIFGIPNSADMSQHFRFAQTYYDSMATGNYFPSWAGGENFGYGDIGIRFYPPLSYYVLAFARIIVGNWYDATWLTFAFWMIVGCCGIYFWMRCWFSAKESLVAALFYLIIPFHLSQLYISYNNYSEFAASSILVFCFLFLTKVFKNGKLSDILGLGFFYALLILTHLPMSIIGSLCLFIFALTFLRTDDFTHSVLKSIAAAGIGITASAFYWVGMVSELDWVNHSAERFTSGHFNFTSSFFPLVYFEEKEVPLAMTLSVDVISALTFLFLISALIYLVYKRKHKSETTKTDSVFRTVLPLGLFAALMASPLSYPLWLLISPLQRIQFPIRWMAVVAICGAITAGAAFHYLIKGNFLKRRLWVYGCSASALLLFVCNTFCILSPTSFIPVARDSFENELRALPEKESFDCWWTIWSKPNAFESQEKVSIAGREIRIISWQSENKTFEISAGNGSIVRIGSFYYPHWKATVNGNPVEIEKDENGVMMLPVSSKKSSVEIYFQEPLKVQTAVFLSLFTWLFLGSSYLFVFGRKLFHSKLKLQLLPNV